MKLLNISQFAKISEGCPFAVEISQKSNFKFYDKRDPKSHGKAFWMFRYGKRNLSVTNPLNSLVKINPYYA